MQETAGPTRATLIDATLVYAHGLAALVTLLVAVTFGILISLQFFLPDLVGGLPALSWGRLRYGHTQGIMLGWLGNAFLAFLYHAVPVMTGRPVTSPRLGWWLFGIWNLAVMAPGWTLVLAGISQPLEWAEFPPVVDVFVTAGLLMALIQFLPGFFRRGLDDLYVSSWYVIGALVFTLCAYPMGNVLPEMVPGAAGAAFSGLWIHDAVGLFVTPLALAILYFVIPAVTGRPIYSHFLSMVGFWGLFLLYPLNGTHHYIFSVIPMAAQTTAIAASALLGVDVIIVVTNLLLSLRGAGVFPRDVGLRFVAMSTIFYLVVSLQGSLQAHISLNQAVHFTDWVIGHSHLAMLGFATFAAAGGLVHAWRRIPGARYHARLVNHAYWLLLVGVIIMVVDLTLAGLAESAAWRDGQPWIESLRAARPYWIIRTWSAVPVAGGFIALLAGLLTGPRADGVPVTTPASAPPALPDAGVAPAGRPARTVRYAYAIAGIAGLVFFALSVALLGAWPQRVLAAQTAATSPAALPPLTPAEVRGRAVYAREGCGYCHTQQIRFVAADIARFGAPTLAWESQLDVPHQMGTRRIGPDLSRASGTRPMDWHLLHLYAPRTVVPESIMPGYAWLFDGAPDSPTRDALDLVAYLETLGRARELAWPEGDAIARAALPDDQWSRMAFDVPLLNAHPARADDRDDAPASGPAADEPRGAALWTAHCASCHGTTGGGDGPAAGWLTPRPTDLTERVYRRDRIAGALWNGVRGTAMPAWRDHPPADLAALAEVVRGFADAGPVATADAATLATGAEVYANHCAQCHGAAGGGDGFAADELPLAPTSFRAQQPSLAVALRALRDGVAGTPMAPWTDRLNEDELNAVAHYVRSLFEPDPPGGGQR